MSDALVLSFVALTGAQQVLIWWLLHQWRKTIDSAKRAVDGWGEALDASRERGAA